MNIENKAISEENNLTAVTEFILLGFQISQYLRILLFCLFLLVYCVAICGNLLIITLVSTSKNLHTPMYFFISQLAVKCRIRKSLQVLYATDQGIKGLSHLHRPDRQHSSAKPHLPHLPCVIVLGRYAENNLTATNELLLLGFQGSQNLRISVLCLLSVIYCGTICGNLLIITLVSISKNLHTPMYFFISQLAISDVLLATDIVPNMLHILLNNGGTITFTGCVSQHYFFGAAETLQCFLLTVMSYDRYVAICNPLRYASIMTWSCCVKLVFLCWLACFTITLSYTTSILMLDLCGTNIIDHFYCDLLPLLDISCSDTFFVQVEIYVLSVPGVFIPTIIIITSYVNIVCTILRIRSSTGQKAFSTCSSHLIVVSIFYWTMFSVYVFPRKGQTLTINKVLSLLYTVFTPFINPIIYSLRNKDIKKALQKTLWKVFFDLK
ncbi:Olfactory receptor [Pristimantis euphronides]